MRRVRTPVVLQLEAVECGAASLAMVLAHYGRYVPLEELRVACGVSRDGTKAGNIARAARGYGLKAQGYRKEPEDLRSLRLPAILYWNFNHFLVLEGLGAQFVYLNDPASGHRAVPWDEFNDSFTGVAITFEPDEGFERSAKPGGLVRPLAKRLRGSGVALLYTILVGLALVLPGLVVPAFSRIFVDTILVARMDTWIKPLLLGMTATVVLQAILVWLQQVYLARLETRIALSTSGSFLWHVLRLPYEFFVHRYAGEIGARVGLNDHVAVLLSGQLATNLLNLLTAAFYAALMFSYDAVLGSVALVIALVNLLGLRIVSARRAEENQKRLNERGKLTGVSMHGLSMIETFKASGCELDFFARWSGYQAKALNAQQRLEIPTEFLKVTPVFLTAVNTAIVLGVGGLRVMDGHLTMGMLIAFQALVTNFIDPINKLVLFGGTLQNIEGDLTRLDDVLRSPATPEPDDDVGAAAGMRLRGTLELRDVTFGYSRLEPPLLEKFNLTIAPGSRVALVGGSGCGKSTVSRLVSGLFEPWSGEVLFDGRVRSDFPRVAMTSSFAVVDQEISLFEGTVLDNITMWDPTIEEADVVEAAKDAGIHDDIAARKGGYHSRVAEGGSNFSGGQRQRLEIARALVRRPSVLVLDEATSALDPATEHLIDDNLRRRGCTCLIVAHRLSTIRDCDEIIVLDRGKVVQRGRHEQLSREDGPYARLVGAEAKKAKPHLEFAK
jgi:NHLM bacteriocin system ABC transporter peptidase/ATP-binding protein